MLQNVFFIDDDKPTTIINERLAKRSLLFNSIKTFNHSDEALDYLRSIQNEKELLPCLIFLDINMPASNGWSFLKTFNTIDFPKKIFIIMLSTTDIVENSMKEMYKEVIYTYETKPLTIEKIKKHTTAICP